MSEAKAFTDEDLKRLKEEVFFLEPYGKETKGQLDALLARLEAAEVWAKCHQEFCNKGKDCSAYVAWRKTAGK